MGAIKIKQIRITLDNKDHKRIKKAKGNLTWEEFLIHCSILLKGGKENVKNKI